MNDSSEQDTRTRILQAAGPIFAEKGFQAATVREICEAAGANQASINYYFGDKESLYLETLREAHRLRNEHLPSLSSLEEAPAEERLYRFVHRMLTRFLRESASPWPYQLMLREIIHPTQACESLVEDFIRPEFDVLMGIMRELLPSGTPHEVLCRCAFSVVGQCLHYRVAHYVVARLVPEETRQEHFQLDDLARHITEFTLAALQHLPQAASRIGRS